VKPDSSFEDNLSQTADIKDIEIDLSGPPPSFSFTNNIKDITTFVEGMDSAVENRVKDELQSIMTMLENRQITEKSFKKKKKFIEKWVESK
jgi:hypothetical protein